MKRYLILALSLSACQSAPHILSTQSTPPKLNINQTSNASDQTQPIYATVNSRPGKKGMNLTVTIRLQDGFSTQALNCNTTATMGPVTQINQFKVELVGVGMDAVMHPVEAPSDGLIPTSGCNLISTVTFSDVPVGSARALLIDAHNSSSPTNSLGKASAVFKPEDGSSAVSFEVSPNTSPTADIIGDIMDNASLAEPIKRHLLSVLDLAKVQSLVDAITETTNSFGSRTYVVHPSLVKTPDIANFIVTNKSDPNTALLNLRSDIIGSVVPRSTYLKTTGTLSTKIIGINKGAPLHVRYNDSSSAVTKVSVPSSSEMTINISNTYPNAFSVPLEAINLTAPPRVVATPLPYNHSGNVMDLAPPLAASWMSPANGLNGGRITALAYSPQGVSPAYLYAGVEGGGVFVSTDTGANWSYKFPTGQPRDIVSIAAVPNSTTAYAATKTKVFKTTDGGNSWIGIFDLSVTPNFYVNRLSITDGSNEVYAATNKGIYRTTTGDASWVAVSGIIGALNIVNVVKSGSNYFAAVNDGSTHKIYASSDGSTWTQAKDFGSDNITAFGLADSLLVAGIQATNTRIETAAVGNPGIFSAYGAPALSLPSSTRITSIDKGQSPGDILIGTDKQGAWRGTSSGWSEINPTGPNFINHPHITEIIGQTTEPIVATYGGGVSQTFSTSWLTKNNGLNGQYVTAFAQHPGDPLVVAAATKGGGIFLSSDGGQNWSPKHEGLYNNPGERDVYSLSFDNNGHLYAGMRGVGVRVLNNPASCSGPGWTWHNAASGLPVSNSIVTALHAVDGKVFAGFAPVDNSTQSGLYAFTATALSFSTCTSPPDSAPSWSATSVTNAIYALKSFPGGSSGNFKVFAGTDAGQILTSTDSGSNWSGPTTISGLSSPVIGFAASPDILNRIYAIAFEAQGIRMSSDAGNTWVNISGNLPSDSDAKIKSIANFSQNANHILLGLANGEIWRTTSSGQATLQKPSNNWHNFSPVPVFQNMGMPAMLISANGQFMLAGTGGHGLWRQDLTP